MQNLEKILQKPILVYILVSASDIAITAYGMILGYPEGNPVLSWMPDFCIILLLVGITISVVLLISWVLNATPSRMVPLLSIAIYTMCAYRFIFGTLSWTWLFTGYQPAWIVGGI